MVQDLVHCTDVVDKIAFGNIYDPVLPHLIIISGGNVGYLTSASTIEDYPTKNELESIHDPAQAYNALTVGSYTRMDRIDQNVWQGVKPLASNGGMSPSNSTSLIWDNQWPNKPDLVFEGGNLAIDNTQIFDNYYFSKKNFLSSKQTNSRNFYFASKFVDRKLSVIKQNSFKNYATKIIISDTLYCLKFFYCRSSK